MASTAQAPEQHALGQERKKLRKVLRRFDLIFFTLAAFISLDTIAVTAAYGGGQTLFWLLFLIVVYFVPYGMIVAELGSTFPVEGGPYAWPRMAFGRLAGALTAVFYWMSNPVWMGGSLVAAAIAALNTLVFPDNPLGTWASIFVGLAIVWSIAGLSMVEMKWGKWTGIIGTVVRFLTLAIFLVLVVVFLFQSGKPAGTVTFSDMRPTLVGFLAVIGLLQFLFVGFELSSGAAEEMTNPQKDVPKMIVRSGLIATIVTSSMVFGVLLVIPGDALGNVYGFAEAYQAVAGALGGASSGFGYFVAALMILTLISAGGVWLQGAVRVQAVAALDGAAPLWFGKFSKKSGTPLTMNILSALMGSAFVVIVFLISSGSLASFFAVVVSIVISLTALMYLFIIPSVIPLRRKYPDHTRPYRVPGGTVGLWLAVIGAESIIVITTITLVWPGLLDALLGQSYDITYWWGVSRVYFESVTMGILAFFVLTSIVFWLIGKRNIKKGLVGENDLLALDPQTQDAAKTCDAPIIETPATEAT